MKCSLPCVTHLSFLEDGEVLFKNAKWNSVFPFSAGVHPVNSMWPLTNLTKQKRESVKENKLRLISCPNSFLSCEEGQNNIYIFLWNPSYAQTLSEAHAKLHTPAWLESVLVRVNGRARPPAALHCYNHPSAGLGEK